MDRVGARNTLIVLITVVTLTLASFTALLILVLRGDPIPDLLQGICTLLLGTLTGSAVTLGAQPKVPESQPLVVNQAIGVPEDLEEPDDLLDVGPAEEGHPEGLPFSPDNGPDLPPDPAAEYEPGAAPKGEF